MLVPRLAAGSCRGMRNQVLHPLPGSGLQNGGVLAGVRLSLMSDLTVVEDVGQEPPQRVWCKRATGTELTRFTCPALESPSSLLDLRQRQQGGTMLLEQRKNGAHTLGLFFVHHQPSAVRRNIVAQHRASSHPFPLSPGCRHFVAGAFADQLPFELRET